MLPEIMDYFLSKNVLGCKSHAITLFGTALFFIKTMIDEQDNTSAILLNCNIITHTALRSSS